MDVPITKVQVRGFRSIADTGLLDLGPITVLIGRNNSGKSALLRALFQVQDGALMTDSEKRLRTGPGPSVYIGMDLAPPYPTGITERWNAAQGPVPDVVRLSADGDPRVPRILWDAAGQGVDTTGRLTSERPRHLFVPVFSRRKGQIYDTSIERQKSKLILPTDQNIVSRIATLSGNHAEARRFHELVDRVLGEHVETVTVERGQDLGVSISTDEYILMSSMGEGVSSALAILSELALPGPQVFLVEEPENDLHPTALRELLAVMVDANRQAGTQFLVSTHSDFVLRFLGSQPDAVVYHVDVQPDESGIPASTYKRLEDAYDRHAALVELGYEFSMPTGWLVFEEASAESFIMSCLVPAFAPKLAGLNHVNAKGTGNVGRMVDDLWRVVLFVHISDREQPRAWVMVDGDPSGLSAVEELRKRYRDWPAERFVAFSQNGIEEYYPDRFAEEVSAISAEPDKRKRMSMKGDLAMKICRWYMADPEVAKPELAVSAAEIINLLEGIEQQIGALFE
jgi:predicted ATPase